MNETAFLFTLGAITYLAIAPVLIWLLIPRFRQPSFETFEPMVAGRDISPGPREKPSPRRTPKRRFPWGAFVSGATLFVAAIGAFSGVYFGWRADGREAAEASLRVKELEFKVAELQRAQRSRPPAEPAAH